MSSLTLVDRYRAMLDKLDTASREGTTPYPIAGER